MNHVGLAQFPLHIIQPSVTLAKPKLSIPATGIKRRDRMDFVIVTDGR
jgi:hypothetical protein